MLITFLVRSQQFHQKAYHRFYSDVEGAFDLAYMLNENPKTIQFKCLLDECLLTEIPGSSYRPSKLVTSFNYSQE